MVIPGLLGVATDPAARPRLNTGWGRVNGTNAVTWAQHKRFAIKNAAGRNVFSLTTRAIACSTAVEDLHACHGGRRLSRSGRRPRRFHCENHGYQWRPRDSGDASAGILSRIHIFLSFRDGFCRASAKLWLKGIVKALRTIAITGLTATREIHVLTTAFQAPADFSS